MSGFKGFPAEGLQFFRDLEQNNHRDWFESNKQVYVKAIQQPAQAFIEDLGAHLQSIVPDIYFDTRTNGSGSLMRINRDTRFSADKTPYKTRIAMMFWEGAGKKTESPAFGFQFSANKGEGMAGIFTFTKPFLEKYRQAVLDETLGSRLLEALKRVAQSGQYTINGDAYKRVPAGYDAAHPRAEFLKYTGLAVFCPTMSPEEMMTPQLVDICFEHCKAMLPVQQWLAAVQDQTF